MTRIWLLGAPDSEMVAIEALLTEVGERVEYARDCAGERVHPGNAYAAPLSAAQIRVALDGGVIYLVECVELPMAGGQTDELRRRIRRIDHHDPGDPGYGRPPAEFLAASSIGQVVSELARLGRLPVGWRRMRAGWAAPLTPKIGLSGPEDWTGAPWLRAGPGGIDVWDIVEDAETFRRLPSALVLIAAADHCLGAAYRGECPGVGPDELMRWRAESCAAHQGRSVAEILADIEATTEALLAAPCLPALRPTGRTVRTGCGDPGHEYAMEYSCEACERVQADCCGPSPCGCALAGVRDMRRRTEPWPELPEAACRAGVGYVSGPLKCPDGRQKVTCSGTAEQVAAFLATWAPRQGLVDCYGDPARGFAGAYLVGDEDAAR